MSEPWIHLVIYLPPIILSALLTLTFGGGLRFFAFNLCFTLLGTLLGVLSRKP